LAKISNRVAKLESEIEPKYTDVYAVHVTIPYETGPTYLLYLLNPSVAGTGQNGQRIGSKTNNQRLDLRLALQSEAANFIDNRVRVVVFWFKNGIGSAPVPNQLFDLAVIPNPSYAPYNYQYMESFSIVYDKTYILKPLDSNAGVAPTIGDRIEINKSWNLRNEESRFVTGAGAGTYVDILDGALFMAFMTSSNSGAAAVNNPTITFGSRCWYTDA
jgi:hypothetical protein